MKRYRSLFWSRSLFLCAIAGISAVAGCDRESMVRVYEVDAAKPAPPTSAASSTDAVDQAASPKRMLGAIIPIEATAVFLKMTGEPAALERYRDAVETMATSLRLEGTNRVEFDVPEGWQRTEGNSIAVAKVVPPEMQGVDGPLTVTILSGAQDAAGWNAVLQSNLDRWRGQLGLPPVPLDQEDASNVRPTPSGSSEMNTYLIDYVGTGSGSMQGPMMNAVPPATSADPAAAGRAADREIASGTAAEESDVTLPPVTPQDKSKVEYALPDEWVEAEPMSIRLVSLKTGSGPEAADVSFVMAGGEDASIVELWAGSVFGQAQPSREQIDAILADAAEVTAANGVKGKLYFVVVPSTAPDAETTESATHVNDPAIMGVIFDAQGSAGETDGRRGFVKMSGPRGEVEANRAKFRSFVESLKW